MDRAGRFDDTDVQKRDVRKLVTEQLRIRDARIKRNDDLQRRRILQCHDREQEVTQVTPAIDDGHDDR